MNSVIVWILCVTLAGGYCLENIKIQFNTEKECETAKAGLDQKHKDLATCTPKKKDGY